MSEFHLITGPILIGTQFNWGLLGLLTIQVYHFYIRFPKERLAIKAFVYWLFFLDLAQTAFTSHFAFGLLVTSWGDPAVFAKLPWSQCTVPIMAGLVSAQVQVFFAWRIYVLGGERSRFVLGICVLVIALALLQSLPSIISGIKYANTSSKLGEIPALILSVKIWLFGSAVCDVIITATMIFLLNQYRKMTSWKKTDSILTKLIFHTVQTGAVTSIAAIVEVVLFLVYPQFFYHEVPGFILGKMYSNAVLATLNARSAVPFDDGTIKGDGVCTVESHQLQWVSSNSEGRGGDTSHRVHITTATQIGDRLDAKTSSI
ncbi:hypothetical protein DFH06DRAFT_1305270 [Mycena polygramma]|nr:hypothetical protein DFH06DRAFT_1305270 [Mycena polygramma]